MSNEQTQQDNTPDGTEGIIGTYCPFRRGWWFNGEKVPRFEPNVEAPAIRVQKGKRYRRRDGRATEPLADGHYLFCDPGTDETYTITGRLHRDSEEHPQDLVEELAEPDSVS